MKNSWIERFSENLGLIPRLERTPPPEPLREPGPLERYPSPDQWDDFVELDAQAWPKRVERHYSIVPTTCFNCEAACGLLAYIDKETNQVRKFEGNPYHPGSRGKNCAKGPATINQIKDSQRILFPLKRSGERGAGKWERISWGQAVKEIAAKIRKSLEADRRDKVVYHVGRPGHEGYAERVLKAWQVDGHNSHTNICSAGARTGYSLWHKYDRPSPDHANAEAILLLSSHLETGHYFNPHAQRIIEGMMGGAKLIVMDPRLSNTASMADLWLPTYPGSEAAVLLAMARILIEKRWVDWDYVQYWVNWDEYLAANHPEAPRTMATFLAKVLDEYDEFTPEFAAAESGLKPEQIVEAARIVGRAGNRFAAHVWRSAAIGNLGGWQVARCLHFLSVLTGSVGTEGGTAPSGWQKFHPSFFDIPPAPPVWNELHFPREYPLCHYEMSPILPYLIREGRGSMDVYFTRVFNPVWTYPDGFSWIEMLTNEKSVGCHIALTPTWNETAYFADYVLPMGHASERHDINSYETHAATWIAFRQPVMREKARREGKPVTYTWEVNPGEVWEEDEFWIELSWEIDKDEKLGIREHFMSPYREGQKITVDEYYQYIFEKTPGLAETASKEGLSALDYMRKYGAFEVEQKTYLKNYKPLSAEEMQGAGVLPGGTIMRDGKSIGVQIEGRNFEGFPTPSRKQEFYSRTMIEFGYPEHALPGYIRSHVHPDKLDQEGFEFVLLPTFRLPTHIHSRSSNSKWLSEIAHRNPVWLHTTDGRRLGVRTGDLIKVETEIGWFVDKVWVTEAIRPGVVACSHHIGRWRRSQDAESGWMSNTVRISSPEPGVWKMSTAEGVKPFESSDPDSLRIFWKDGGVHQNITHAPHPDPISGAHCWLQKVRLSRPGPGEEYGQIMVDTNRSFEVYKEWNQWAKDRARHPDGMRRPAWMNRPLAPVAGAWKLPEDEE